MKSTLTILLAAAAVTLGVVYAVHRRDSAGQRARIVSLQGELNERAQQMEALRASQERTEQQRSELLGALQAAQKRAEEQRRESSAQLKARQAAETNPPQDAKKGGLDNMLSKMLQDPDTRRVVRATQRLMMDQLYTPLIGRMGLTPDEAGRFKDLMADHMMGAAELASTNGGDMSGALMQSARDSFDEQVKAFLGDARYAQYKDYEETLAERMQLNAFQQQAGGDVKLNDQQTEALLSIMKGERNDVAAAVGLPVGDADKDPTKLQVLLSEDKMDELLQVQQTIGQHVYERARTILSSAQLDAFGRFQTNQMQMMPAFMNMTRKMFAPGPSPAEAAPPTQ
ncbi:MAG: hypothetical protein ACLQM8_21650 [Limisphaerales bacterium]